MAKEIERKFLVIGEGWQALGQAAHVRQGYLSTNDRCSVRVRKAGASSTVTIKSAPARLARMEYEYDIPPGDADEMLDLLCKQPVIEKNRYRIVSDDVVWEVDEFLGVNRGLVVAEVELRAEDETFVRPDWIGEEVTGDPRYLN